VVDEITQYVAVRELKVLCLVSRKTGDVATRRLYHTILLNGLRGSVECLRTLAVRRDIARCVRKLTMYVPFGLSMYELNLTPEHIAYLLHRRLSLGCAP
jgi:hypothetical protein